MSAGPQWCGRHLFQGRILIGHICAAKDRPEWIGFCHLPGARAVIGRDFRSDAEARAAVLDSANSRCKEMFGAGLATTEGAVSKGRALRVVARAIYRAGRWTCDRPANAQALFEDLRKAAGLPEDAAPGPAGEGETAAEYAPGATAELEVIE